MRMMRKFSIISIFCVIIIFALGWTVGLLVQGWSFFIYDNSFNLFDLIYFIFSGGIALFITSRIEEALQTRRGQKDIILQKIDEVDERIKKLSISFNYDKSFFIINNTELLMKIKEFGMIASHYEKSVEKYYPHLAKNKEFCKISSARKLVKICTSDRNRIDAYCVQDCWHYSYGKYIEIISELNRLSQICFNNKLLLNNS